MLGLAPSPGRGWPAGARRGPVARCACREATALERGLTVGVREVRGPLGRTAAEMRQKELIVTMNETSSTADVGATAGMAKWKGGAPRRSAPPAGGGAVYGLGMIGALVYFLGSAESGRDYVLGFGKALVWPALLVYRAFKVLGG
jgi:hypothetical protein